MPPGSRATLRGEAFAGLWVVLKGHCTLQSEGGDVEVAASYAVLIAPGVAGECHCGADGATVAKVSLDLRTAPPPSTPLRLEDSHSYYLVSRLVAGHLQGRAAAWVAANLQQIAAHVQNLLEQRGQADETGVAPVVQLIHDRPLVPFPLEELADVARVHPMTLARRFRQSRGCSIGEFRQRVRAERAFYRVIKTPTPLADLSLVCGYADQSHMTRHFRRFFDTTPNALRRIVGARMGQAFA